MTIATRCYYGLGYLMPLAGMDVEYSSPSPSAWMPGQIGFLLDRYGERYLMAIQNRSGSTMAQGSLVSSVGDTTGLTAYTATGGTLTSVIGAATLTANKHVGAMIIIKDDAGAAGAAPEGEDSIVESNSTTTLKVINALPFSVAPANGDTTEIFGTWNCEAAAAGDYSGVVKGVVIPESGIPDTYFGIVQLFGICRKVNVLLNAVLAPGSMLIAAAASVTVTGAASGHRLHVGQSIGTVSTDQVLSKCVARLAVGQYGKSYSDVDALA
jgi:hypothetical protein